LVEEVKGVGHRLHGAGEPLQRALLDTRAELVVAKDRLRDLQLSLDQAEEAAKVQFLSGHQWV
jgi:hypothetical protein